MPVTPWSAERQARIAQALTEEAAERRRQAPAAREVNLDLAAALDGDALLPYRGRVYRVAPLPVSLGMRLYRLNARAKALAAREAERGGLDDDELVELEENAEAQIDLFHACLRPPRCPRGLWRLRPNPFRASSDAEVSQLGKFFLLCRMRTRFQQSPSDRSAARRP